jgi:putative ABC transport system permease protein
MRVIEVILQDVRYGCRTLRNNPGFSVVVVLTLALGIGASTAIYSVVNALLLNPISGAAPDRLVQIAERMYTRGQFKEESDKPFFGGVAPPALEIISANQSLFSGLTWADNAHWDRKTADFTERLSGEWVAANFFSLLRVNPLLGRTFTKEDATPIDMNGLPERNAVMVLSYRGWQSKFGKDPRIIGQTIELSGHHFTVIGVMPSSFQFPWGGASFWVAGEPPRWGPGWGASPDIRLFAWLKPGVTAQRARAMLDVLAQRLAADPRAGKFFRGDWNQRPGGLGFWMRPARLLVTDGASDLQRTLFGLMAAIGFVLLIVCANVANLTLAKTEKRQRELAVRAALGAGRARLVWQLLTESLLLAALGGLGGLAVAWAGMKLLAAMVPEYLPRMNAVRLDGHALGFALFVSVLTGLIFGIAPAWNAGRNQLGEALKQAGTHQTIGVARRRLRSALVVGEVALTLVLLAGAGLMIDSVARLLHVDLGFDPENLLRVRVDLPWSKYNDPEHTEHCSQLRRVLFTQISERLVHLPGVKAVGIGKHGLPTQIELEGRAQPVEALLDGCGIDQDDLFRAMRIPLRAGRTFDQHDLGEGVGTTIINETAAHALWPGSDPLGKKFTAATWPRPRQYEVIGVVGDLRDERFDQPPKPTFYRPCHELGLEGLQPFFLVRTAADPRHLIPAIRQELKQAEPEMRTPSISVSRQALYDSTQAQRTYMLYLIVFAVVGLALSALGVYGVLAYSVTRRTAEIGVRMALGADRQSVLCLVLVEGVRLAGLGVAAGLLAAFWLTRLLRHQLYQVRPTDPIVFAGAVLVLGVVALAACLVPAWRAVRINPMAALRDE